jgi:DNA repair exonuclease SbcCD ATPase subunit/DNA repair exonuclease SbcCD nuclease subunit
MKILIWSDAHISPNAPYSKPRPDGLTDHLYEVMDWFRWIHGVILEEKPDFVIDLGDLFSTYGYVDVKSMHVAWAGVQAVGSAARSVEAEYLFLLGNHDLYNRMMHNLPWFPGKIIDKPMVIPQGTLQMGFLPYGYQLVDDKDFAAIDPHCDLLFTHNDYKEIPYQTGRHPETGDSVQSFQGLAIFNGHYHIPQHYRLGSTEFYNVGSLGPRTFRDCGPVGGIPESHGAWMIDTSEPESTKINFLENPYCTYRVRVDQKNPTLLQDLASSSIANRTVVRFETDNAAVEIPPESLVKLKQVDVVTLPPLIGAEKSTAVAGLSLDSDPLHVIVDYLVACADDNQLPEGIKVETLVDLAKTIVTKAQGQQQTKSAISQVQFLGVTAQNFMSLGNVALNFPVGVYSVVGINKDGSSKEDGEHFENNGAGKTNLFELIYWVLTGGSIRKQLPAKEVINENAKECVGSLSLTVGGDTVYTLTRTHKKKGGQTLQVSQDGEDITPRLQDGAHTTLSELLSVDKDLLRYLVFLMGGLSVSLTELGPTDRFRLLERLVGDLAIYDVCAKEVSSILTALSNDHEGKRGELRGVEVTITQNTSTIQRLQEEIKQVDQNNVVVLAQLQQQKQEALLAAGVCQQVIDSCTTAKELASTNLQEYRKQREDVQTQIVTNSAAAANANASLSSLKSSQRHEHQLVQDGQCPTCGAATSTPDRTEALSVLPGQIEVAQNNVNTIAAKTTELQSSDNRLREAIGGLEHEIRGHDNEIAHQASHQNKCNKEAETVEGQITAVQSSRSNLEQQVVAVEGEMSSAQDKKAHIDLELVALEERIRMLRVLYYPSAKSGIFSPAGVRSQVLETVLAFLNFRCEEYSKYLMLPGKTVRIKGTSTNSKGKTVSKINIKLEGVKRSYASLSAGEKRRVDLILHLSLRDLAQASARFRANILVLDEVMDPMDNQGVRDALRLLETFAGDTSIWIITQSNRLRGELDSGVLVTKENGVSTILPLEH